MVSVAQFSRIAVSRLLAPLDFAMTVSRWSVDQWAELEAPIRTTDFRQEIGRSLAILVKPTTVPALQTRPERC